MAAMVNMSNLLNGKDSRWLQLEVCREFQRNKCSRPDTECKFAHPPANVEVQNGRVTACYDSIKGRCNREKPPCKYFHPPQHLKDQLLINGRNHLALKNALMQQMGMATPTPPPAIIPNPLQPMTANRFLPTSNPYNPYFTTGTLLPTTIIGPEHAALASTTSLPPQAVSLGSATNNAAQPQKRTDRVQNTPTTSQTPTSNSHSITNSSVPLISSASILANLVESGKKRSAECLQMNQMKLTTPYYYDRFIFPGLLPYKRPAPDKPSTTGIQAIYQPSAAAYQQLMQLQSAQQSYVPVSSQQNSINQSSPSSKAIIPSNIIDNNALSKNVAVVASSNISTTAPDDDGDSENAVQNAKTQINANGIDVNGVANSNSTNNNNNLINNSELVVEENNNKSISDMSNGTSSDLTKLNNNTISIGKNGNNNHVVDDATNKTSIQSSIDESNLNAISFNSATSSSPAATLPAIFTTTSSITTTSVNSYNYNNNIYSRKNSFTTPNQQIINNSSSKTPLNSYTSNSGKVENVPDFINASSLNNPQAALLSAVFYNQPYQQFALAPNLYSDPAQLAKEMAQKNYVNALKLAAAAQSPSAAMAAHTTNMSGKNHSANQLTALPYSGMTLPTNNNSAAAAAMLQSGQLAGTSVTAQRLPQQISTSTRPPFIPATALTRPMQNPYQNAFIRPQFQTPNLTNAAAANPYFAAHQQFLNQQNFLYSGLTSPMTSPQLTATSVPSQTNATAFATTASYPFSALGQAQALTHAQSLPTTMMQVPQMTSQSPQTGGTSAVVLNPYKKMKTS